MRYAACLVLVACAHPSDSSTGHERCANGSFSTRIETLPPMPQAYQTQLLVDATGDGVPDAVLLPLEGPAQIVPGSRSGAMGAAISVSTSGGATLAVDDVDGDGHPDLVISSAMLELWLGDGAGGFRRASTANVAADSLLLADLDGDGTLDVIAGHRTTGTVTVLFNPGGGQLGTPVEIAAGTDQFPTTALAVADFDGDGHPDLATSTTCCTVTVLTRVGTTYTPHTYPAPSQDTAPWIQSLQAASLTESGRHELLVTVAGDPPLGTVTYGLVADGSGGLAMTGTVGLQTPFRIATADLDGDGRDEVIDASGNVLQLPAAGAALPAQPSASADALAVADTDGDGRPELLRLASGTLAIQQLGANGRFIQPRPLDPGSVAAAPSGQDVNARTADLDGDGHLDIILAAPTLRVYRGRGAGAFELASQPPAPAGAVFDVAIADLDDDGVLDLAALTSNAVLVFRASDGFATAVSVPLASGGQTISTGDLDGDGRADLVVGMPDTTPQGPHGPLVPGSVTVLRRTGAASFTASTLPIATTHVQLADADRDGHLDLVIDTGVHRGNGDGTFADAPPTSPSPKLLLDVDGDGILDLVDDNEGQLSISLGRGDGTFAAPSAGPSVNAPAFADLDGDGILDIFDGTKWLGAPGLQFTAAGSYRLFGKPTVADLDEDGNPDVISGTDTAFLDFQRCTP